MKEIKQVFKQEFLQDGFYIGYWTSHLIKVSYNNCDFEMRTSDGIKGRNVPVILKIEDEKVISYHELINKP